MYTNNRNTFRETFFQAWQKYLRHENLLSFEKNIIDVILQHPKYQKFLADNKNLLEKEFTLEENPFLHMSLHISLAEQLQMNRPFGIKNIYDQLSQHYPTPHEAQHAMITILANYLWQTQQSGSMPDEEVYLQKLQQLLT